MIRAAFAGTILGVTFASAAFSGGVEPFFWVWLLMAMFAGPGAFVLGILLASFLRATRGAFESRKAYLFFTALISAPVGWLNLRATAAVLGLSGDAGRDALTLSGLAGGVGLGWGVAWALPAGRGRPTPALRYGERLDGRRAAATAAILFALCSPFAVVAYCGGRPTAQEIPFVLGIIALSPAAGALFGGLHVTLLRGVDPRGLAVPGVGTLAGALIGGGTAVLCRAPLAETMVGAGAILGLLTAEILAREERVRRTGPSRLSSFEQEALHRAIRSSTALEEAPGPIPRRRALSFGLWILVLTGLGLGFLSFPWSRLFPPSEGAW